LIPTIQTVLITGADCALSRAIIGMLPDSLRIRAVDTRFSTPLPQALQGIEGDLRDPKFMAGQLQDVDTVLHFAPISTLPESPSEAIDITARGAYVLMTTALAAGVKRLILGSTLDIFDRLPASWKVTEMWRPRPTPELGQLVPWLAELSVRESVRATEMRAVCLRFGRLVDDAMVASAPYDPRWLHIEDAVSGVQRALEMAASEMLPRGWSLFHIAAPGERAKVRSARAVRNWAGQPFGYEPTHDFQEQADKAPVPPETSVEDWKRALAPQVSIPARKIHRAVLFGAGGPLGAVVAEEMAPAYTLRLTDVRSLAEIAEEGKPQSEGSPLPHPFPPPHENRVVDVRDAAQVMAACEDMDVIVNCSVLRYDPADAFRVNTLGAYHIACAAVQHNIRRLVQTGPVLTLSSDPPDYAWDYDLAADVPPRPHRELYFHSKYLGQEILRVFADYYDLEVPVLLYCHFVNPELLGKWGWVHPLSISWRDSARSVRRAVETQALERRYEVFHIGADMPHGVYDNTKARVQLGWEPQDDLEPAWQR
jgi:nucleoside-diphosphate-sugar epimerase